MGLESAKRMALFHQLLGLPVDLVQFLGGDFPLGDDRLPEQLQRVAVTPVFLFFPGTVGEGIVENGVAVVAVSEAFPGESGLLQPWPWLRPARRRRRRQKRPCRQRGFRACCRPRRGSATWEAERAYSTGVDSAYWLFSQQKMTGSFQTEARFMLSWRTPWLAPPSPKKATATR